MNRKDHLLSSLLFLVFILGGILVYFLIDYGAWTASVTILTSVIFYLWGVCLPDLDHQKVHQKVFGLKWLGKVSHHRGHFHSIIAALVYGFIVFLATYFVFHYWYFLVVSAILGYISHLIEDDVKRYKQSHKPKRGFKIW